MYCCRKSRSGKIGSATRGSPWSRQKVKRARGSSAASKMPLKSPSQPTVRYRDNPEVGDGDATVDERAGAVPVLDGDGHQRRLGRAIHRGFPTSAFEASFPQLRIVIALLRAGFLKKTGRSEGALRPGSGQAPLRLPGRATRPALGSQPSCSLAFWERAAAHRRHLLDSQAGLSICTQCSPLDLDSEKDREPQRSGLPPARGCRARTPCSS